MAPYRYENLEVSAHKILKGKVTLTDTEKKKANECLNEIFDALEFEMKKDPAFDELSRQKQYVGSFYENLKIDMPDEFDIDFELHIPSYIGKLQICESEQPGFCHLKLFEDLRLVSDPRKAEAKKQVNKWTDHEGFLSINKVNNWMISVVDKALREYEQTNKQKLFQFIRSRSGPAVTLSVKLIKYPELHLSLDFVPVFVFGEWQKLGNLRDWEPEMEVEKWYAVPKSNDSEKDFRLCFWHQEKYLLCGTNQMKSVLKLIKKLRDIQQWTGICSYYIKTMFLWKTAKHGKSYWCKGVGVTFIEMLNELKDYLLEHNALPFFWMEEFDLLSKLKLAEKTNIGGYLQNMLKEIEKNLDKPGFLERYFIKSDRTVDPNPEISSVTHCLSWNTGLQPFEEDSEDEVSWDTPISSSLVNRNPQLLTRQQESNTGTIAAIAIGAAALFAVGFLATAAAGSRRPRD